MDEKIRSDFPVLNREGKPIIYLDSACQTLRPNQVIDKINEYYKEYPACGGRSLHKLGKMVDEKVIESRKRMQKFIGAKKSEEVIFTKNTTEGINIILNSLSLKSGDAVITTDKEHNSVLLPVQFLAKRKGIEHKITKSNDDGTFNLDKFQELLTPEVKLVSVVHTSNIDGFTNPAKEIVKAAHDNGSLVLLDGAQSVPHKEVDVKKLDVDFLAFSGHKMCGPSGTGILYGKYDLLKNMEPIFVGGETVSNSTYTTSEMENPPERFEPGLQNYAGMVGLAEAARYLQKIGMDKIQRHDVELNKYLTENARDLGLQILGPSDPGLRSGVFSFNIKGLDPHEIAIMLDHTNNIAVRSGMHCVHSWFNENEIKGSVRASMYFYNTKEEIETFISTLKEIIKLR
ncbi:MAG: cysteine desulfurase [Candidatus Aenigmarchaeota archaeon]|nr:cysteine desulfurase [Candidatus Aenigmarchaeota archaeon]